MIRRPLPSAIQNDQSWRRAGSVSIEILLAQRHGHIRQARIVALADGFDIGPFLRRRSVGPLCCIAVELGWPDDDQALASELLPQARNYGDFGLAVNAPMRTEEQNDGRTFQ